MFRYKRLILAGVAVLYAVAAVVFPDVLLPDRELVEELLTALGEALTEEGTP